MAEKYIESFEHELLKPFDYTVKGQQATAKTLTVYAPNNKVSQWTVLLDQQFSKALFNMQEKFKNLVSEEERQKAVADKKAKDSNEEDDIDSIVSILLSSSEVDKCLIALQCILTKEHAGKANCLVDGVEPLKTPLYDDLSYQDTKALLGKYIKNFISTSLSA